MLSIEHLTAQKMIKRKGSALKMLPMYKRYENTKAVGTAYISGTFGLVVREPDKNDMFDCDFICSWCNGENEWGFHKHMVHYTTAGRPFIRKGNMRIYVDEIMRC